MKNLIVLAMLILVIGSCKKDSDDGPGYPTDGLVTYLDFENDLVDQQGGVPDGVNTGGSAFVAGKSGQAISFNGSNQYVTFARKSFKSGNNVTVAFWFKTPAPLGLNFFLNCGDFYVFTAGNDAGISISVPTTNSASGGFTSNTWTHFAGVYDGTNIKAYINGSLVELTSHPGSIAAANVNLEIGYTSQFNEYWEGSVDELFIYSKALTEAEVQQLYNL